MRKKKNNASKRVHFQSLPLINPNAAGIDVGAKEHLVAVPADRAPQPVRTFQAFIQNRMEPGQELCSQPYSFDLTAPHESCSETPGREERHVTAER
jgi:hypothetical protein